MCWDKETGKAKSNTGVVNTRQMLTDVGKYWVRKGFQCRTSPNLNCLSAYSEFNSEGKSRRYLQNSAEQHEGGCSRDPVENVSFPHHWSSSLNLWLFHLHAFLHMASLLAFLPYQPILLTQIIQGFLMPSTYVVRIHHTACPWGFHAPLVPYSKQQLWLFWACFISLVMCNHLEQELCLLSPGNSTHSILSTCTMLCNDKDTEEDLLKWQYFDI